MKNIYSKFNLGIRWNTFEALTYQIALTTHNLVLFSKLDRITFGVVGTFFSLVYLSITLFNFGFDKSLSPFFLIYTQSKNNFKKIFLSQFLIQIFILAFIFMFLIFFHEKASLFFAQKFKCCVFPRLIWILLGMTLLLEGAKKTLRSLAQIAFYNKQAALIEVSALFIYLSMVWGAYFYNNTLSIYSIFIPFVIQSIFSVFFLAALSIKLYWDIEDQENKEDVHLFFRIIKNRFNNYWNQISHTIFSGNYFIVFFGYLYGLEKISILKLANTVGIFFTVILERVFGFTSGALLANIKNLSIAEKRHAFYIATQRLIYVLYGIFIFTLINYKNFFMRFTNVSSTDNWSAAYIFLLITLFENFFITYDQLFLVEEKVYYFVLLNVVSAILFYSSIYFTNTSLLMSLIFLFTIRIIAFLVTQVFAIYKWNIKAPYLIKYKYILTYVFISLLAHLFLR